jgi:hypothetical protein
MFGDPRSTGEEEQALGAHPPEPAGNCIADTLSSSPHCAGIKGFEAFIGAVQLNFRTLKQTRGGLFHTL